MDSKVESAEWKWWRWQNRRDKFHILFKRVNLTEKLIFSSVFVVCVICELGVNGWMDRGEGKGKKRETKKRRRRTNGEMDDGWMK